MATSSEDMQSRGCSHSMKFLVKNNAVEDLVRVVVGMSEEHRRCLVVDHDPVAKLCRILILDDPGRVNQTGKVRTLNFKIGLID